MKKLFFFFFCSISIVIFSVNFKAYASTEKFNLGYNSIEKCDLIYGMSEEELYDYSFLDLIQNIENEKLIESGVLTSTLEFRVYKATFYLVASLTFEASKIRKYEASCDDVLFYQIDISNFDYEIVKSDPFIFIDAFDESASCQETMGRFDFDDVNFFTGVDNNDFYSCMDLFDKVLFKILCGQMKIDKPSVTASTILSTPSINFIANSIFNNPYIYKSNFKTLNDMIKAGSYSAIIYEYDNDMYYRYDLTIISYNMDVVLDNFSVDIGNTLTEADIIYKIKTTKDLNIKKYEIDLSSYEENKDVVGTYPASINFMTDDSYFYNLKFNIVINEPAGQIPIPTTTTEPAVTTTDSPKQTTTTKSQSPTTTTRTRTTTTKTTTTTSNVSILTTILEYSYKDEKTVKDVIKDIVIKNGDKYTVDISSSYFDHKNIPNNYDAYVKVSNNGTIYAEKNITIKVVDDVSPVIICSDLTINTNTLLSLNDLKNKIIAVDEIDGEISSNNISLIDLNNYEKSNNKEGKYQFEASVNDKSGNTTKCYFYLNVDASNYQNYNDNRIINVTNSYIIDEESILAFLQKNGLVSGKNIRLESSYFDTVYLEGDYSLNVITSNDNNLFTIHILDNSNYVNNIENTTSGNSFNYKYIIYISIGAMILGIVILGIFTFRKKKNN